MSDVVQVICLFLSCLSVVAVFPPLSVSVALLQELLQHQEHKVQRVEQKRSSRRIFKPCCESDVSLH